MSTLRTIQIKNSAQKGIRILFLSEDKELAETIEAKSEIDPAFQRIDVYSTALASEARDIARRHAVDLAIFPDGVDGKDFVALQLELRHARPEIELIALIDIPSVSQLRESREIGGIVDFEKKSSIHDY